MTTTRCDNLATRLATWLANGFAVAPLDDSVCVVRTPLLDRNRNALQFYVDWTRGEQLVLSDDGQTLNELEMSGLVLDSERRREIFDTVLRIHGIALNESRELTVVTTEDEFALKSSELLHAMLEVGGMADLTYSTVETIFLEDVRRFLDERDIPAVANVQFEGESGFTQTFDFVVQPDTHHPETLIKTVPTPDRHAFEHLMFAWTDIRSRREPNSRAMAIINDREALPSSDQLFALSHYDITPVPWSERGEVERILKANGN